MTRDAIVGLVFFGAIGLLAYFTIIVTDAPMAGLSGPSGAQHRYTVVFDSVAGLERGMKVKASGLDVGEVSEMRLTDEGKVEVTIATWQRIPLRDDYRVLIKDVSPLGGKYVDVEPGANGAPSTDDRGPLAGSARGGFLEEGGVFLDEIKGDVKEAVSEIRGTFENLREITDQIKKGEGTIGRLYSDARLYDELLGTVKDLREFSAKLNAPDSTIGKLMTTDELHENLNSAVRRIDDLAARLQRGEGTAGKLFTDSGLYDEVQSLARELRDALQGDGTIGKLVKDGSLYDRLNAAAADAQAMFSDAKALLADARAGEGTLGKLLTDDSLYTALKDAVVDIKEITGGLRRGEGTLGKLLTDDELYVKLKGVVGELSRSIEDTREQAPITTFTSVIFSAF